MKKKLLSIIAFTLVLLYSHSLYSQGELWGLASQGGYGGVGVVFRTNSEGNGFLLQKDFYTPFPGHEPSNLTLHNNGKLYGTTMRGGSEGTGVLYEFDPISNEFTNKIDFTKQTGQYPSGRLALGPNGKFYGTVREGIGAIYEFDPIANTIQKRFDFNYSTGANPYGSLALASNGKFYGLTNRGGANNKGVLYEFDPVTNAYLVRFEFDGMSGDNSWTGLTLGSNGQFYGTTNSGGVNGAGVLFSYDPIGNVYEKKYDFITTEGSYPNSNLMLAGNGKFYGTTYSGGLGNTGTIYEFDPATNSYSKVTDAYYPSGPLSEASNGQLYGVSQGGLYELNLSTNVYTIKFDFASGVNGTYPSGNLQFLNDKFYGTTERNGLGKSGVIFEYDIVTASYAKLIDFEGAPNGSTPQGKLAQLANGKFYGVTTKGGDFGKGVIFEYDPVSNEISKKYDFNSPQNPLNIYSNSLTLATNGKLYGTHAYAGSLDMGVLFEYNPITNITLIIKTFSGADGAYPLELTLAENGKLYGLTRYQGSSTHQAGTLYELDPKDNTFTKKHDFTRTSYPEEPNSLTLGANGKLYGITKYGGVNEKGTLFEYDLINGYRKLWDFGNGLSDEYNPSSLTLGKNGKLYGTTSSSYGILFEFDLVTNSFARKFDLNDGSGYTGSDPIGNLTCATNGKLYGFTRLGGTNLRGVMYEFDILTNTFTKKVDLNFPSLTMLNLMQVRQAQNITFNPLPSKAYGDPPFVIPASSSSGLPLTFTSSNTSVLTISGNVATIVGPGSVSISVRQIGNIDYLPATEEITQSVYIPVGQTITFNPLSSKTYGDSQFTLDAVSTSGLPVSFSSSNSSVISISGNTATIVGAGLATITATQPGDITYGPAVPVQQDITVNKTSLTATADTKIKTYGDANPVLTFTYLGFIGTDNESVLDTPPSITTTAITNSDVGSYPITLTGATDNNYTFALVNSSLTVSKATLTATADAKTKEYRQTNPALTITYTGFKGIDNASVIDTPPAISTTAIATSNVGIYPITVTGGADNNYDLILVGNTLTINKAPLTATAEAKTKIYGDANPVLTLIYSGFKGLDNPGVIDSPPSISTSAVTTSNVGAYPITLAGGMDDNYALTLVNGSLTVNKATLTVTAGAKTKVYGDANPTLTFTYSGFKGADNEGVIDTPPSISSTAITTSNVGSYPITLAGGTDNNYTLTLVNSTLTINKAALTATADAKTKVYGEVNPTLTFVYSGFKGADNASVIDAPPSISTTAITTSNVGSYPITFAGGTDNNYTLTLVNSTLTINKAILTATADAKTKIYGDVNPALTITYTGFKGIDNASVIDTPPSFSTTAITTSNVGSYPITLAGGTDNNYTLTLVNSTLTINKATVTATADAKTKTYGDVNPALTITYTGFKGADNASVIDTYPSISTTAITTSNVGSYPIVLAGGTDNNYALSLVNGTMSVTKAILTVTADAKSKMYAALNPVLTFTYAGFIGSEDVSVLDAQPSISTTAILTSDAGTYPITLTGGFDNNYSFTFINSLLTVYRGEQTLLFGPLADRTIGDGPFILLAIGGPSGNPVTFTSSNSAVAIVFGNVVTIVGSGSTIITASQIGNTNYNTATPIIQSLTVNAANQTITFNELPMKNFGDITFNPGATASSGLAVSYTSSDPAVASIVGNMISIVGPGTTTIIARQLGNANYAAAADVEQTLTVNPSPLVVTPSSSTICFGTSATLVATGAATYTWSPSTGLSSSNGSSVVARPSVTTTYTITATYPNGVTESTTTTIKVNAMPLAGGGNHSVIKYCGSCGGYVTTSGQNTSGQLGNGTTTQSTNPVTLPLSGIEAVAAGTTHSLFLKSDGTVWASGLNSSGQLGDGTFTNRLSPVQVTGLTGIVAISAGNTHSLFLKDDGTVWACGLNSDGQLGDGTLTQRNIAIQVVGLTEVIKISAGGLHSLFLKNDGTVWATGRNTNGQLGDGTSVGKTSVVNIPSLSGITEIAGGGNHSHFLKSNGTVWATGLNSNGQLGNGTTASRNTPIALATINFVTSISGGTNHTLFLRNDGTAWSAGQNSNGQLGDGTTTQSSAPLLVGLLNVRAIDAGATHSLFLTDDGSVWAAGRNANGQLGDGTTTMRTLPVQTVNVSPCGRSATKDDSLEPIAETHFEPLQVYPNPANNELTIDLPQGASNQIIPIQVFDNYGKLIAHDSFNAGEASKTISIDKLPSGLYILRVETVNGFLSKKITIIH